MNESEGAKAPNPEQGGKSKDLSPLPINDGKVLEVEAITEEAANLPALHNEKQTQEIQRVFNNSPIDSLTTPEQILAFAETVVNAGMCPYKKPEDAVLAIITGKEMGLSLAATFGGIYAIEGRPSLGVHIKKGILLQNNVIFKKIRDFEDYYEFVDIPKEGRPSILGYGYIEDLPKYKELAETKVGKKKIDVATEYLFTRYFNTYKGVVKNTARGIFRWSEAIQAGLAEKGTWKKYSRDMLASRAFSKGANEIADDLLHGMYSYSELADINDGVTYYIDENGHEQIVQ